jgi:hypothetical protein
VEGFERLCKEGKHDQMLFEKRILGKVFETQT